MSNANRDYAIVYDVKNSLLVLSRPLNFYLTDKNTSNIFVKLVTRVNVGNGIDQYTDIENASGYVLTMRVIKPDDEVKSLTATQHESESIFQFDLTEDFKDIPGKYICELTISNIVNGRQEFTTSDPFNYEVKRSILSNVKNIIEGKDTTVEKLLNDLDATKAELTSQIKEARKKSESITMADLHTDVKLAMTGGSVGVVGYESVGIENLDPNLFNKVFASNRYVIGTVFDTCALANGATNNNNTVTIPSGSSGINTLIRFKNEDYEFKIQQYLDVYFIIEVNDVNGLNFGRFLKVKRNGSYVDADLVITHSTSRIGENKYLVGARFKVLKGDKFPSPILEIADNTLMNDVTMTVESMQLYNINDKISEEVKSLNSEIDVKVKDLSNRIINNFNKSQYIIPTDYSTCTLANGATNVDNIITIPSGSTGVNTLVRFACTDNHIFKIDTTLTVYFRVVTTDMDKLTFGRYLKVTRNGVVTNADLLENVSAITLEDNVYLVGARFKVLKGDKFPSPILELTGNSSSNEVTIKVKGIQFYSIHSYLTGQFSNGKTLMYDGNEVPKAYVLSDVTDDIYVEITQNINTTLRAYGVKNNTKYQLSCTNLNTGFTTKEMVYCSKYKINHEGFDTIKFENTCSDNGRSKLKAKYYVNENITPIACIGDYHNRIDFSKITNEVKTVNNISIFAVRDGKLLGAKLNNGVVDIVQSDTNYDNFTTIATLTNETQMILQMLVNGDNSVIIACKSGAILRTEDFITFDEVLNISTHQFRFGAFSQWDSYGNIVVISEYKQPATYANLDREARNVYVSTDYGRTFKAKFNLIDHISGQTTGAMHVHSVKYDPYEGIIWLITGDGFNNQMVFYSMDLGANWYQAVEYTQSPVQFTQVVPLRNCVLFLSDARLTGVVRYNRPTCGTLPGVKMHFDMPMIIKEGWGKDTGTEVPIGSVPYIDYANSKAYFGFATVTNTNTASSLLKYGNIFATDGYYIEEIFKSTDEVADGVLAVYGDKNNNKVIGKLGMSGKFVIMNSDIWEKC